MLSPHSSHTVVYIHPGALTQRLQHILHTLENPRLPSLDRLFVPNGRPAFAGGRISPFQQSSNQLKQQVHRNGVPKAQPKPKATSSKETDKPLKRSGNAFAPDRPLPRHTITEEPLAETNACHTQLGTREGRKGKYVQAREFDAQGKPVRDIDFTDHGRPKNHPNPHQHVYEENLTGGTKSRDNIGREVPEWSYE